MISFQIQIFQVLVDIINQINHDIEIVLKNDELAEKGLKNVENVPS